MLKPLLLSGPSGICCSWDEGGCLLGQVAIPVPVCILSCHMSFKKHAGPVYQVRQRIFRTAKPFILEQAPVWLFPTPDLGLLSSLPRFWTSHLPPFFRLSGSPARQWRTLTTGGCRSQRQEAQWELQSSSTVHLCSRVMTLSAAMLCGNAELSFLVWVVSSHFCVACCHPDHRQLLEASAILCNPASPAPTTAIIGDITYLWNQRSYLERRKSLLE